MPANFSEGRLDVARISVAFSDELFRNELRASLEYEPRIIPWSARDGAPSRARLRSGFDIRPREPHVFCDVEYLTLIQKKLVRPEGSASVTAVALYGMRGVGKSTLAAVYAHRHKEDYRVAWWINAENDDALKKDLIRLGRELNWVAVGETAFDLVLRKVASADDLMLLIYDNAQSHTQDFETFLPKGGKAHVLITSNDKAWGGIATPVHIDVWSRAVGGDYLCRRVEDNRTMREDAEDLSAELEGLPLALEQAAAYCEQRSFGFRRYIMALRDLGPEILNDKEAVPSDYSWTVVMTFTLAIEEVAKRQEAAKVLIVLAALLAPEPIPADLFPDGGGAFDEPLATQLGNPSFEATLSVLRRFALVYADQIKNSQVEVFRLHRLVRDIAASSKFARELGLRETLEWLLLGMIQQALAARRDGPSKDETRYDLRLLVPHARYLIKRVTTPEMNDERHGQVRDVAHRLSKICKLAHDVEDADELFSIVVEHSKPDSEELVEALAERATHNGDGLGIKLAEQLYAQASKILDDAPFAVSKWLSIRVIANHGRMLHNLGRVTQAQQAFARVVGANFEEGDLESQLDLAWAKLHHRQFTYERAPTPEASLEALQNLVELRTEVASLGAQFHSRGDYTNLLAWTDANLGLAYFGCNQDDMAWTHIMATRMAFLELENIIGRGWSDLNLAKIAWRTAPEGVVNTETERRRIAREYLLEALGVFYDYDKDRMRDRRSVAFCFDALALVFEVSDPEFSWVLVKKAESLRDEHGTALTSVDVDETERLRARLRQKLGEMNENVDGIAVREIVERLASMA